MKHLENTEGCKEHVGFEGVSARAFPADNPST